MKPDQIVNRAGFRAAGLQGRRTSEFVPVKGKPTMHPDLDGGLVPDGRWRGKPIGSFLGRLPAISYAPAALRRYQAQAGRLLRQEPVRVPGATRDKRAEHRARVAL